jgi:beta-RFAP synthase
MPSDWICHLILPQGFRRAGLDEAAFFRENTPIERESVLQVLSAVYHGICPAVASADLDLFRRALLQINGAGFKRREVMAQPPELAALLRRVNGNPALAAGMSSMGPLVYVIGAADQGEDARGELEGICASFEAKYLGGYRFRNAGFEVDR